MESTTMTSKNRNTVLTGRFNGGVKFAINAATIAELQAKVQKELIERGSTEIPPGLIHIDIEGKDGMKYVLVTGLAEDVANCLESRKTTKKGQFVIAFREEGMLAAALYYDGNVKAGKAIGKAVVDAVKTILGTSFDAAVSIYGAAGKLVVIGTLETLRNASQEMKIFFNRVGCAMFDAAGTLRGTKGEKTNLLFPFEEMHRGVAAWTPGMLESWKVIAALGTRTRHAFLPNQGVVELDIESGEVRIATFADIDAGKTNPWRKTCSVRTGAENISELVVMPGKQPYYLAFVYYQNEGKPTYVELKIDPKAFTATAGKETELNGDLPTGALVKIDLPTGTTVHADQNGGDTAFEFGRVEDLAGMLSPEIIARVGQPSWTTTQA